MEIPQSSNAITMNRLPSAPESQSGISSDFETFLRMLTAQMKNQDPLNPVESADFATQLATFSGVEQAVLTNDLLRGLSLQIGVSGLASWVGKEVRALLNDAGRCADMSAALRTAARPEAADTVAAEVLSLIRP